MSGQPTDQVNPDHDNTGADGDGRAPGQRLTPGAVLDHGRYRLLAHIGDDPRSDAQLWRAKDGVLGRDVALTILVGDRADASTATDARRTLERAMHASTFNHVGVARILDVVNSSPGDPEGVLGVVIAEWTHGTDLIDLVAEGPMPPGTAARLLQPLAAAVEAAHHAGLVLGTDHPQRIRVTADGDVRMAFPGPLPHATSSEDVRGLGAVLYLLLTGRWALTGAPDGTPGAPTGPDGTIVAPRTLRPGVPLELSTVAVRALGSPESHGTTGGVRTGAAVLRVLEQHASTESATMQAVPAGSSSHDNEVWSHEDPAPDPEKRKKLLIGTAVLAVATLLVLGTIVAGLVGMFAGTGGEKGPSVVLQPDGRGGTPEQQAQPGQPPPKPAAPVKITASDVFVTEQNRDNRDDADLVHDGNPTTHWNTDGYNDQLGSGFKNGIGLILTLDEPTSVTEVIVNSPSQGTRVEVRAVSGTSPSLSAAEVIGTGTLREGQTRIKVDSAKPTSHVLVWITKLSKNDRFSSQINEIQVLGRPAQA